MADDEDDFDDGIWDVVDQLVEKQQQSKVGTTGSQAPNAAFQQPVSHGSMLSNQTKLPLYQQQPQQQAQQQLPSWRQPIQQRPLPAAPPAKPASLAQQLGSTGPSQFARPPSANYQHNFGLGYGSMQQQNQQQRNWNQQPQQQWGAPLQQQQQQQQYHNSVASQMPRVAAVAPPALTALAGNAAAAAAPAAPAAHAGPSGQNAPAAWQVTQQQQQQQQQSGQGQQQQQASMIELQKKLAALEQEKFDLQRRLQQQSQNSIAQHKQNDLLKQVGMLKERLMFAEQEAKEAKTKLADKESRTGQTEEKLKQLQQDAAHKEEALRQLQFELDQEKKRAERLAAAAAGAPAGSGPHTNRQTQAELASPAAAAAAAGGGGVTPSSSSIGGRKRRHSGTTAAAAAAAGAAASGQLTPQQQQRQQQMMQLLGEKPVQHNAALHRQQQQQQTNLAVAPDGAEATRMNAYVMEVDTPQPPSSTAADSAVLQQAVQPAVQQQQDAGQQQQQQQQQVRIISSILPALQQVRISRPQISQLVWSSCKGAVQQLLQPLHAQLSGLASCRPPSSSSSANTQQQQQQQQEEEGVPPQLPEVLSAVQQHLLSTGSSSSSGASLMLQLLHLAVVLFPDGGFVEAVGHAGMAGHDGCKWILQPSSVNSGSSSDSTLTQQQQQQQRRFLVFRAADNMQQLHILPLPLALAMLQLLQGLVQYDDSCIGLFAAGVGAAAIPGSYQQLQLRRCFNSSSGSSEKAGGPGQFSNQRSMHTAAAAAACGGDSSSHGIVEGGSSSAAAAAAAHAGLNGQLQLNSRNLHNASIAAASYWGPVVASLDASLSGNSVGAPPKLPAAAAAAGTSRYDSSSSSRRSLLELLADISSCHTQLMQHVGAVVATLASRLPVQLRQLLLVRPVSEKLLVQLLHAESYHARCHGMSLLHELLKCLPAAAAFAAAIQNTAAADVTDPAAAAAAAGQADVVMEDAAAGGGALQPSNKGSNARSNTTAGQTAAATSGKRQQQQQQGEGPGSEPPPAAAAAAAAPSLPSQAVYDILLGLLECSSAGIDEGLVQHNSSIGSSSDIIISSSSSSSSISGLSEKDQWGCFELQRRCCAVVAQLLHSRHVLLLQLLMGQQFTSGYGLAQRLLVVADAACSAAGGDPFSIAAPKAATAAAAAASSSSSSSVSNICGAKYGWQECLQRVRLAHESLLLLRALVASPGPIGAAAMSDLASNTSSLRLIMTTRAKLSEWSEALLAAAATQPPTAAGTAGIPAVFPVASVAGGEAQPGVTSAAAAAAAALPLAPWAWLFSSNCGCRGSSKGTTAESATAAAADVSANAAAAGVNAAAAQLLKAQRPSLQACLHELSNSAASVHRRVMIWIKSLESAG